MSIPNFLTLSSIKPHLSGTLWSVEKAVSGWTAEQLDYLRAFDDVLVENRKSLVKVTTSKSGLPEILPIEAGVCFQQERLPSKDDDTLFRPLRSVDLPSIEKTRAIAATGFGYCIGGLAPWSKVELLESRWELVLFTFSWPFVLVSHTASVKHEAMIDLFNDKLAAAGYSLWIRQTSRELLNEAFIGETTYSTILAGVHRPTVAKPDRKSLAGRDLRQALDPYNDQSYAYVYGVAKLRLEQLRKFSRERGIAERIETAFPRTAHRHDPVIGYGQEKRKISVSASRDFVEYARRIDLIRAILDVTKKRLASPHKTGFVYNDPLNLTYLSSKVSVIELNGVREPFEIHFNYDLDGAQPDERSELDVAFLEWTRRGDFSPGKVSRDSLGAISVELTAGWEGKPLCELLLMIDPENEERIVSRVKVTKRLAESSEFSKGHETLNTLLDGLTGNPMNVRFESGHVFINGQLYKPSLTEVLFDEWRWIPAVVGARTYDMTTEKPDSWAFGATDTPLSRIETSGSLFSRVALHVPELFHVKAASQSWALLCHDQPQEIADFVFIDAAKDQRRIEFVHVKSAGKAPQRQIAIEPYEKVVPQAIKNLSNLDLRTMAKRFPASGSGGAEIGIFMVSSDGRKPVLSTKTKKFREMLKELSRFGPPRSARVICLAPHVPSYVWEEETAKFGHPTLQPSRAAYMLSMLLLDAKAACTRMNATFEIWSEQALRHPKLTGNLVKRAKR